MFGPGWVIMVRLASTYRVKKKTAGGEISAQYSDLVATVQDDFSRLQYKAWFHGKRQEFAATTTVQNYP